MPIVAFLAERSKVGPVEPKVRPFGDGDDVVGDGRRLDAAGVGAEEAERVSGQEEKADLLPVVAVTSAGG